ncbi:Structural maintenance of chromosomes protein 6 [Neofusicoccum ribis]|uniref:Structural maintenance of chromosomes protein 6 n=1 Tax=Neofusicoccum ribis TaxID=45134 RepID=A0ABR3SLQ7_9PEZI
MVPQPSKRHRAPTDLESDDYGLESEGPSNRRDSRKRQRLSAASDIYEDGDDMVLSDNNQDAMVDPLASDYDNSFMDGVMVDAETGEFDVDSLLGNEASRLAGLQRLIERRFKRETENYAAENAIIEEVKCVNFMCHAYLTVPLGPLINFVIGHNGSGKSAVMTALTLCLGAKATATNRGQSLKSFIKEGEDAAMLAVKIKNHGTSAFKPELYGKTIIVERHFNKNGASGFKIKNVKEKVVSTKKTDLEDIIDAFQLQMDNPMNVLSQDMARQFLNHSTPADKFKFFLEGTQIAALDRDYRVLEEYLHEIEDKRATKAQDKQMLGKKKDEAQEKVRALGKQDQMRAKAALVRRQFAWKQIEVEEETLEAADGHIAEAQAEVDQKTADVEDASNRFDQAEHDLEQAQQKVQECDEAKQPIQDRLEEAKAAFNKGKEDLQKVLAQHREIKSTLQGDNNVIKKIEDDIQEERRRQEDANGGEHGRRMRDVQEAKAMAQEKKTACEELRQSFPALETERSEAQTLVDEFQPTIEQKRVDVRQQENQIREITQNQGKEMAGFDQNLPALLRAIDENGTRFRNKPVGPMGRHVRLLKPEWSNILEKQAGVQLNAFVVTSKHDESILRELMRRTNYPRDRGNVTPVLIGDPRRLDTSGNEPEPHLLTWMRALQFDNDLVRNQMIINNMIDQTVLIEDSGEALKFAYGDERGGSNARPRNVRQVFTMTRDKRDGIRYGWASSGAAQQSPIISQNRRRPRMQTEIESLLNVAASDLRQYKLDLQQSENQLREKQAALTRANQALERHKRDFKNLRLEAQRAQDEAESLQDALEAETPQAGRLEELERQLDDAKGARETNKGMFVDAQNERDRINVDQRQRKDRQTEIEQELAEANTRLSKAQVRTNRVREKRDEALHMKNQAFDALEVAKEQINSYQRQREEQREKLANMTEQAAIVGERPHIPPGETVDSLQRKYERLKAEIQAQEQRLGGSAEDLKAAAFAAIAAFKNAKRDLYQMETALHVLKQTLVNRRARLVLFRRTIADRSRITFTYLLAARKFRGDLKIDQKAKELDLSVEPDITKAGAEGRQTRTLSGGEKSFSTVCLLLSLWDAMGAPTRCLDEFDVFMDSVNREISMKMIIEACRSSASRQFLFITPQAMGNVSLGQDVKIIKMSDPERGQTTLAF